LLKPLANLRRSLWLAALLFLSASPVMAERQLIVSVTGPIAKQLRSGVFLPEDKVVKLGTKDHIVVVDSKGARGFSGPRSLSFNRDPAQRVVGDDWMNKIISNPQPIVRLAGVREVKTVHFSVGNPFVFVLIPPKPSGPICFSRRSIVILQRMSRDQKSLNIVANGSSQTGSVTFDNEATAAQWPERLIPRLGTVGRYRISDPDNRAIARSVILKRVQDDGSSWVEFGQSLTRNKCSNSDRLLAMREWDVTPKVITTL
jgi:hypothetical protein